MTTYYFASRYSRHPELRGYRDQLTKALPHASVTSRWLDLHDGKVPTTAPPEALNADPSQWWPYALADLSDLEAADVLVSFLGHPGGKGGRHIEHGYAMAIGHRIAIIGDRENVFHCDPDAEHYPTWEAFLAHETEMESHERL